MVSKKKRRPRTARHDHRIGPAERDVNGSDMDEYLYLFSHFLSDSDMNTDRLRYRYECRLFQLRIRLDMMSRIQRELDADNVEHGYFFGYRVKAIFIHITLNTI